MGAQRPAFAKYGVWAGMENAWEQEKFEAALCEMPLPKGRAARCPKGSSPTRQVRAVLGGVFTPLYGNRNHKFQ